MLDPGVRGLRHVPGAADRRRAGSVHQRVAGGSHRLPLPGLSDGRAQRDLRRVLPGDPTTRLTLESGQGSKCMIRLGSRPRCWN